MSFSDRLKMLRKQKNLTQEQLSKSIGINKSAIAMYETGQREPKIEIIRLFADFFNVDMNYITDSEDISLGPRIKELRERLNITQEELASRVGYKGRSMISRLEKGNTGIPLKKIPIFAKALQTSPEELMEFDSKPSVPMYLSSLILEQKIQLEKDFDDILEDLNTIQTISCDVIKPNHPLSVLKDTVERIRKKIPSADYSTIEDIIKLRGMISFLRAYLDSLTKLYKV